MNGILIPGGTPGLSHTLTVHRFGQPGARPKAYVQAALHADEVPGMLTARVLCDRLAALDAAGSIVGEVLVLPVANPIALAQRVLGGRIGRFDLADGANFNRLHAALAPGAIARVDGRLGADAAANVALFRAALRAELDAVPAHTPAQHLKRILLGLALDADLVLDLHCDGEAVMHLYTLTPAADTGATLASCLGAQALLLATESGDDPFDEACSRPWLLAQAAFPDHPLPLACFAATVELRGQADVASSLAAQDAEGLVTFLRCEGVIAGATPPLPPPCASTPLAAAEPLIAPATGIVVFRCEPGAMVTAGDVVLEIVDPIAGGTTPLSAQGAGLLFARGRPRFAAEGQFLGKIAGTSLSRTGNLLSP